MMRETKKFLWDIFFILLWLYLLWDYCRRNDMTGISLATIGLAVQLGNLFESAYNFNVRHSKNRREEQLDQDTRRREEKE